MRRTRNAAPQRIGLPSVNLLSASAFEKMAARRLRHRFLAAGFVMLLLVNAAWVAQHLRVVEARKLVAVEQAETDRLTSQTQLLAPVRAFVDGVAVQLRTVQAAMANEVYFSDVLDGLTEATPEGAEVQSVSVTITAAAAAAAATGTAAPAASACPGPDPFNTRTVVGCVTLSGTATSRAEVGELVIALGRSRLFVEPFINTTTTADSAAVTFAGSVGLSERVFSGRYVEPAGETAGGAS